MFRLCCCFGLVLRFKWLFYNGGIMSLANMVIAMLVCVCLWGCARARVCEHARLRAYLCV